MPQQNSRAKIINNEDPSDFIYIHYIPNDITESVDANYGEKADIIGRTSPFQFYQSTGARNIQLQLQFFALENAQEEVVDRCRWLESFVYPDYSTQIMKPPKLLRFILGNQFLDITGVLKSFSVTWKEPYDVLTGRPMQAELSFQLTEVVDDDPPDFRNFKPTILRQPDRSLIP